MFGYEMDVMILATFPLIDKKLAISKIADKATKDSKTAANKLVTDTIKRTSLWFQIKPLWKEERICS